MTSEFEVLTYEQWLEKYQPELDSDGQPKIYETYGRDLVTIQATDPKYVWTLGDEDGQSYIDPGKYFVNRINYYICTVPWERNNVQVQFEDEGDDDGPRCRVCDIPIKQGDICYGCKDAKQ